ncbi:hypothetical protein GCM10010435_96270 [Winogradskya consettensis]|uniref:Uncharacterized protein n=1 Tax=Winogradskya consettensis TaxID=113560 RepID=A0A919SX80_9ACTN|nr:hypothetical protein Aco04nite_64900 [Actinoplanes consettensis]
MVLGVGAVQAAGAADAGVATSETPSVSTTMECFHFITIGLPPCDIKRPPSMRVNTRILFACEYSRASNTVTG